MLCRARLGRTKAIIKKLAVASITIACASVSALYRALRLVEVFGDNMPLKPAIGIQWYKSSPYQISCRTPEKI